MKANYSLVVHEASWKSSWDLRRREKPGGEQAGGPVRVCGTGGMEMGKGKGPSLV